MAHMTKKERVEYLKELKKEIGLKNFELLMSIKLKNRIEKHGGKKDEK